MILIQAANPALAQEWEKGLRIWSLESVESVTWLPSSIDSNFNDSSPIRVLINLLSACLFLFSLHLGGRSPIFNYILPIIATCAGAIVFVGLVQESLDSSHILGTFRAIEEGFSSFFGTFLYKNHAAAYMNLGIGCSLASFFMWSNGKLKKHRYANSVFILIAGLLLLGVVISKSRFGVLCSLLILLMFVAVKIHQTITPTTIGKRHWFWGMVSTVTVVCGVFLLPKVIDDSNLKTISPEIVEDFSYKQRIQTYKSAVQMFASKPTFGWGAGNFRHAFRIYQDTTDLDGKRKRIIAPHQSYFWQHAHNDYLEWLIELGVVGFLILISIPGYFFWRIFKSKRWREPVPLMLLAGLGSTMIHALVDFPFQNPAILMTWFAILAITTNLCEREQRTAKKKVEL